MASRGLRKTQFFFHLKACERRNFCYGLKKLPDHFNPRPISSNRRGMGKRTSIYPQSEIVYRVYLYDDGIHILDGNSDIAARV